MPSLIQGCVRNGHCRLESLSEATDAYRARKKSSLLQQAKHWLGNKWTDWQTFYLPFAQYFLLGLADKGEIVLVMDGSQTGPANTTLMLSVMCRGFAIPVAWVVKKGDKGHFPDGMHTDLVKMVAQFCPPGCRIVLLGDGEFDGQGLRQWCVENNWLFVVRNWPSGTNATASLTSFPNCQRTSMRFLHEKCVPFEKVYHSFLNTLKASIFFAQQPFVV